MTIAGTGSLTFTISRVATFKAVVTDRGDVMGVVKAEADPNRAKAEMVVAKNFILTLVVFLKLVCWFEIYKWAMCKK